MKKIYLYLIAALTWGVPGIMVATEGITAYCEQQASDLWWLLLITAGVLTAFFCMFRKIVDKYSDTSTDNQAGLIGGEHSPSMAG